MYVRQRYSPQRDREVEAVCQDVLQRSPAPLPGGLHKCGASDNIGNLVNQVLWEQD